MNTTTPSTRTLTSSALAALATFPIIVVSLNVVQRHHYSAVRQAVSELALGHDGALMVIAFLALALGMLLVAVVIRRTAVRSVATPILLGIASIGAGPLSAAFHTDATGAKTTTHGAIHNDAGLGAFLLVMAAMFVSSYRFRRDPAWRGHARPTLIWAGAALAAFFLVPALGNAQFGLAQRIFITTFVTWLAATAIYARGRDLASHPDSQMRRQVAARRTGNA